MPLCRVFIILACLCALLLLPACSGGDREQMLRLLEELERMNRAYELMTNDSLAQQLVEYFDSHGTPNERMRAYYMQGSVYRDLGEAPLALESYLNAVECADTTSSDCDYRTLSRVHYQASKIYDTQVLPRNQLYELRLAESCAWKACDTLTAIECYSQTADAYRLLQRPDSVVYIREKASQMFDAIGDRKNAGMKLGAAVTSAIDIGDIHRARRFINKYEAHSGLLKADGSIQQGREFYYYIKGQYYLAIGQADSAEQMFRRLARDGQSLNDHIASSKGLQEVYERLKIPDSIAKYANLGYQLNDSAYSMAEMENIQRLKASFDYNRNRRLAMEKSFEAERTRNYLYLSVTLAVAVLIVVSFVVILYRRRKLLQMSAFRERLAALEKEQTELMQLRSDDKAEFASVIERKDRNIASLLNEVAEIRKKIIHDTESLEYRLKNAPVVRTLREKLESNPPHPATLENFKELKNLVNANIPLFYDQFQMLRPAEYEICLLIRTYFQPAEISKLTNRSNDYITNIRKRILEKVYGIKGTAKELDERILAIS